MCRVVFEVTKKVELAYHLEKGKKAELFLLIATAHTHTHRHTHHTYINAHRHTGFMDI